MSCAELMIFSILVAVVAISNGEIKVQPPVTHFMMTDQQFFNGENTTECRREDGMFYNGNDIDVKHVEGEEDCANWCGRIKECRVWRLDKCVNYCIIMSSVTGRGYESCVVSGTKGCATASVLAAAVFPVAVVAPAVVPAAVVAPAVVPVAVVAPAVVPAAVVAPAVVPAAVVPAEKGGKDDDSSEDEPFCVAVDCSLPNAENLCPIKCSLQKDPEFCGAVGCSHSNSQTFCPIKCSGVTNLDDVLAEIRGVKTQIEQLKTTLLYHVYGNH